jgi:hypothetical protein
MSAVWITIAAAQRKEEELMTPYFDAYRTYVGTGLGLRVPIGLVVGCGIAAAAIIAASVQCSCSARA